VTLPLKIKRVLLEPDPRLRLPNADVTETWDELEPWVKLMWKAMYRAKNGVGLAAPQVGWNVRLFVMNADQKTFLPSMQRVFWNPSYTGFGEPVLKNEGCLSLPNVYGSIPRFHEIRLEAMTPEGPVIQVHDGFTAHIIQHEIDHLNGKLCFKHWVMEPAGKAATE
jgi:peptide deformylase